MLTRSTLAIAATLLAGLLEAPGGCMTALPSKGSAHAVSRYSTTDMAPDTRGLSPQSQAPTALLYSPA
jgi:hypothetical protein